MKLRSISKFFGVAALAGGLAGCGGEPTGEIGGYEVSCPRRYSDGNVAIDGYNRPILDIADVFADEAVVDSQKNVTDLYRDGKLIDEYPLECAVKFLGNFAR